MSEDFFTNPPTLTRRSFVGILAAVLIQGRGWVDASELPAAPEGFGWQKVDALQARLLVPNGWPLSVEYHNGSHTVYFTKPDSDPIVPTKFAINVLPRMDTKGGSSWTWCKAFVNACLEEQPPLEIWIKEHEKMPSCCVEKIQPADGDFAAFRIRILGICNLETDTVYLVQFESRPERWDEEWPTGRVFFEALSLNEEF
jgi:hypothetical protein